jgi:signal transduction histidine kinase
MSWHWAVLMGFALVAAFFAGRYAAGRALKRKANTLETAARRWSAGDYAVRTALRGKAEIDRLGETFDAMADAVQKREAERAGVEEDLRRSRDEALQASLSKSRFLAAASHDLRQPLQSMSMTVALLDMRHKADADAPVIARLNRAVANLAELLNTLLDISQLEAGLVKPTLKTFSADTLLTEIAEEYSAVAESKGLSFVVQSCDFSVRSDPSMLGRMLRNLVENAIRFTPAGGIIDIFARDRGTELLLIVKDTGIGIPEDRRHEIFRAFQQLNNPERDRSKGLGLGLAIVDRMSRLLGHALVVESIPGQGSTFSITVPKAPLGASAPAQPMLPTEVHGRVLLVEDDELVLTTTAQLLEELGASVTQARSAEDALRRLERESFDLIIADYRLPGSSGVELVSRARQRRPDLAAAIITGDPSIEELKRLVDFDTEVIQKPVRADRLARLFSKVTHA